MPHKDSVSEYRMPAEWSPHSACYVSWPCKRSTWHGHFDRSKAAYAEVIRAIGRFESVTVLATPATREEARRILGEDVELLDADLDDSWVRDNGPIFVRNSQREVAVVKFGFNAWGGKYPPYDKDARVPEVIAQSLHMRLFVAPMILEGGSITVDGDGTLITTEQCLLNRNRNPGLSRARIERVLMEHLGLNKIVWLWRGVEEDITDGHVDGVATFGGPHLVIASSTRDESDPNFANLEENMNRLESSTDAKGKSFEIVKMIQPRPREVEGLHITPGYTNHYIANGGVIVPTYGIPEDGVAIDTLKGAYPGREVVGVDCRYIEIGGGAVHCITQQRPSGMAAQP